MCSVRGVLACGCCEFRLPCREGGTRVSLRLSRFLKSDFSVRVSGYRHSNEMDVHLSQPAGLPSQRTFFLRHSSQETCAFSRRPRFNTAKSLVGTKVKGTCSSTLHFRVPNMICSLVTTVPINRRTSGAS